MPLAPASSSGAGDQVFEVTGRNPKLEITFQPEPIAIQADYFIKRKIFTVLFAVLPIEKRAVVAATRTA